MRPGEGYLEERIHKMIAGRGEQDIQFLVHLTYQTAFVDDDRRLNSRRRHVRPRPGADRDLAGRGTEDCRKSGRYAAKAIVVASPR